MSKKYRIGYTTGVFDLFHIGHLNILKKAKSLCEYLIVGVTVDELVAYKNKHAIIPFNERIEIISSLIYVDEAIAQDNMSKLAAYPKLKFDVVFVGDDWRGSDIWNQYEIEFSKLGVDVVYFPYTQGTSSTKLREVLDCLAKENSKD